MTPGRLISYYEAAQELAVAIKRDLQRDGRISSTTVAQLNKLAVADANVKKLIDTARGLTENEIKH